MKILGIDTTSKYLCLGLYLDGNICEYNLEVGRRLSGLLTEHIQRVLKAQGQSIDDIDYFACGVGPGSFTGIRLGVATIKGLSFIKNRPITAISTLDILAANLNEQPRLIVPAIDAKRDLIYCCSYTNKNGKLKRLSDYSLLNLKEFIKKFSCAAGVLVLGDALGLYKDKMQSQMKNTIFLDKDSWFPKPHNLIRLALKKIEEKDLVNTFNIKPIYLYSKECQIKAR